MNPGPSHRCVRRTKSRSGNGSARVDSVLEPGAPTADSWPPPTTAQCWTSAGGAPSETEHSGPLWTPTGWRLTHSEAEARATPHPAPSRRLGSLSSRAAQKPPHCAGSSETPGWGISEPVPEEVCLEGPGRDAGTSWEGDTSTCPGQRGFRPTRESASPRVGGRTDARLKSEARGWEPASVHGAREREVTETGKHSDHGLSRAEASRVTLPSGDPLDNARPQRACTRIRRRSPASCLTDLHSAPTRCHCPQRPGGRCF